MKFDKGELRLFVEGAWDQGGGGEGGIAEDCISCEERARAAVNFSRTMLAAAPLGIIAYQADGSTVVANEAAARILGASIEQLKAQNFREIESWKDSGLLVAAEKALATGREVEVEAQFTSTFNKWVCLAFRLKPFMHEGQSHLMAVFSDISEKKRAELALSESEERFRQFAENIRVVFWMTNPAKSEMIYISPAYAQIWGRSCESLYKNPISWVESIHAEDRERVLRAALTRQVTGEYTETYRITRPDGSVRWISDRGFPIRNEAGEVYRVVGTAEDITAQRSLEEQLRHAQKMEAIALLAGGVAHDFNNLLTVINGYSDMLIDSEGISEETSEVLKEISRAGERAVKLTRQLLTFSRKQVVHMQELNVNAVVSEVAKMLERLIGENIELTVNLSSSLPAIVGDTGMIEQVLMNLCVNARDAMPKGGELCIDAQAVAVSEKCAQKMDGARAGEFVCLSVADTGCGIRPEDLPRIFEPFFTTKEAGKGTGLGLATVFGIVRQHQGWVAVKSEPERGTRFEIFFPVVALKQTEFAAVGQEGVVSGRRGAETILLVEDEEALRNLGERVLTRMGYSVLVAGNADEALEIWKKEAKRIDLLFTDMVMPGSMSGRKLAKKLQGEKPGLKILFSSGYDPESAGQVLSSTEQAIFLQKPYTLPKLMETVRRILDGK